jgi:hypothetical protein
VVVLRVVLGFLRRCSGGGGMPSSTSSSTCFPNVGNMDKS